MSQRFNLFNTRVQQRHVAAKLIDNHPFHPRPLMLVQQRQCAVDSGKHAAPVYIGHQNHRTLCHLGHAHIDDIAVAQVNLRRAARPFQHQHVKLARQALVDRHDLLAQARLVVVIADGIHAGCHLTHQHYLRFAVAGWLKQNRVHPHVRRDARRFRLENLRAAHLFAVRRNA